MSQKFLETLEEIREDFVELLGDLDQLLEESVDTPRRISLGQLLWALRAQIDKRIEPLKEELREMASKGMPPGMSKIAGAQEDHVVAITVPQPRFALRKKADISELRRVLGEDFDQLFREKTTYTPVKEAIERAFQSAPPEKKKALMRALNQVSGTVRISFRD